MCGQCLNTLNPQSVEAFGQRLTQILNDAGLALMISIGHRTGLLDALGEREWVSSDQLADATNLQERYVREWLGAMVTGQIVNYDAGRAAYQLPREHAALLTRAATPDNFASTTQWIAVLGQVEDDVVDAFRQGGGVHYSAYSRFHDVMAEESAQTVVAAMQDHILPLVPNLVERLEAGIDVLDVGCGAGRALILLAERFPESRFLGFDFSVEAIDKARALTEERGLSNLRFEVRDVTDMQNSGAFDLITAFDAIHDQANPSQVLREIHTALRDDGMFLMQDIASSSRLENNLNHPIGPFLYTISCMHCMTVSLAQGGAGLGTCWGEELATQMLKEAGFVAVEVRQLPHDIFNSYFLATKH